MDRYEAMISPNRKGTNIGILGVCTARWDISFAPKIPCGVPSPSFYGASWLKGADDSCKGGKSLRF